MEEYDGSVYVKFEELPSIKLKSVIPDTNDSFLERITLASKRRYFSLQKNWELELNNIAYCEELNGKVTIPKVVDGKPLEFDGASIPLPWLVSLITIGILRPMGVMLIASIIHDFVYRHGYLLISKGTETPKEIEIERHEADLLLKDIISTINRMPIIGYIGWFFIRIGWVFVKYNNRFFGGTPPIKEIILFILALFSIGILVSIFSWLVPVLFIGVYIIIYVITIFIGKYKKT